MDKVRDRKWTMVLYPEDPSHMNCISILEQNGYSYCGILHNRDKKDPTPTDTHTESPNLEIDDDAQVPDDPSTEYKKKHWHIVLKFPEARWNTAIAQELGITPNYLQPCRNLDRALLYLIHHNYPDKAQYETSELFGPLASSVNKLLTENSEESNVLTLIDLLYTLPTPVTYRAFLVAACRNELYSTFRRLGYGIKMLIDERNLSDKPPINPINESEKFGDFVKGSADNWTYRCDRLDKKGYKPKPLEY